MQRKTTSRTASRCSGKPSALCAQRPVEPGVGCRRGKAFARWGIGRRSVKRGQGREGKLFGSNLALLHRGYRRAHFRSHHRLRPFGDSERHALHLLMLFPTVARACGGGLWSRRLTCAALATAATRLLLCATHRLQPPCQSDHQQHYGEDSFHSPKTTTLSLRCQVNSK